MNDGKKHYRLQFSLDEGECETLGGVFVFDKRTDEQVAAWTPYAGLCEPHGGGQLLDMEEELDFELFPMAHRCSLYWAKELAEFKALVE